ncbi:MAG: patatin-like phospholipase family protein [Actinomycetota bacterium]
MARARMGHEEADVLTPRRGLVLGGGGVLGGTWSVGALDALQEFGIHVDDFDIIVGTSAGSVLGALVTLGVSLEEMRGHYAGDDVGTGPLAHYAFDPDRATGGHRPGVPRLLGPGSPALIASSMRHPGKLPVTAVLSALLPPGSRSLDQVSQLIDAANPTGAWPQRLWVVAMDFVDGHRVVFGRSGAPVAPLADAVVASCSIPGWFAPVAINGRTYVDGGAVSATSVDVLEHMGLDEVYVIAPMVSFATDHPTSLAARLERRWRGEVTKSCLDEAETVRAQGTRVFILGPGPEDLTAMGANLMDASRRRLVLETSMRTSPAGWARSLELRAS